MSKNFKAQDYFRYKKLGKRWRRPVGLQSKLRIKKGGSGRKVSAGYRTPVMLRNKIDGLDVIAVNNVADLSKVGNNIAIIASGVGARKTKMISEKAKELDIRVLNMNKVRFAKRLSKSIEKKHAEKKKHEIEKKKQEKAEKEKKETQKEEVKNEMKSEKSDNEM